MKMFVKGIPRKIFRRIALESCPTVHLGGGPITVSKKYPAIRLEGLFNILPNLGSEFSRTKIFCFENWIFYSHSA